MGVLLWRACVTWSWISLPVESVGIKIYLLLFREKENIIENIVSSYKLQAVLPAPPPLCSDHQVLLSSTLYRVLMVNGRTKISKKDLIRERDLILSTHMNV